MIFLSQHWTKINYILKECKNFTVSNYTYNSNSKYKKYDNECVLCLAVC